MDKPIQVVIADDHPILLEGLRKLLEAEEDIAVVGQAFNGTIIPLAAGYVSFGLLALVVVLWTEEGRLFAPHHPDPAAVPAPAE